MTPILFMMFYSYGIIGLELFDTNNLDHRKDSPYDDNSYVDFTSLPKAMLLLF